MSEQNNAGGSSGEGGQASSGEGGKGGLGLASGGAAGAVTKGSGQGDNKGGDAGANKGDGASTGGTKTGETDWRTSLPEAIRGAKSFEKFKNLEGLASSYLSLEKTMSSDKVALPNPKTATEDDWNNFFTKIGRPESHDKYELKMPEGVNLKINENFSKGFKEAAHKAGLLPGQAANLYGWYMKSAHEMTTTTSKAKQSQMEVEMKALQEEWGGDYDHNVEKARVVVDTFGDDNLKKYLNDSGLAENPNLARFLKKIGDGMLEDKFREGINPALGKSASDIEAEIAKLSADPSIQDTNHPSHKHTVEQRATLFRELDKLKTRKKGA